MTNVLSFNGLDISSSVLLTGLALGTLVEYIPV
jgi:hypothetical protein